ncbi:YbjN domain-containing protein [Leptospira meyeri]|uniref:YbjN domain-containing protein n=1 Tax=Leptospira meyeri TaxID=29508 RepID=UPI0002BD3719|nr:YbjN domain-containing protein [Leptospira meyeri]EMJ86758.1 putative bacterial sensory transduction regulator [Leptospira meyeri serovar Semaranga str. Veldrot Semarang 173]
MQCARTKSLFFFLFTFSFYNIFAELPKTKQIDFSQKSVNIYHAVDKSMIRRVLVSLGYTILGEGEHKFLLEYQDFEMTLLFSGDTSIQFYSSFSSDKQNKNQITNRWNQRMRYSRSYLDEKGKIILESDFDYSGGVTEESLRDFLKKFQVLNSQFSTLLIVVD